MPVHSNCGVEKIKLGLYLSTTSSTGILYILAKYPVQYIWI
jgi:hypothetical protein